MKILKITVPLLLIILVGFFIYQFFILKQPSEQKSEPPVSVQQKATVLSLNPDISSPNTIVSATQTIEINFSDPLENLDQFKHKFEPETKFKLAISDDKKTVRITPEEPLDLGAEYTLFIYPYSKFEGGKELDSEKIYHIKTVKFKGL